MKNWKKLLACLLVSLMALTVFTACDASVGAPTLASQAVNTVSAIRLTSRQASKFFQFFIE